MTEEEKRTLAIENYGQYEVETIMDMLWMAKNTLERSQREGADDMVVNGFAMKVEQLQIVWDAKSGKCG